MVIFDCTNCDFVKSVSDKYAGKNIRCPKCKTPNRLGEPTSKAESPKNKNSIGFLCTDCSQKINVPDKYAGRRIKCPKCQTPLSVPDHRKPAEPELENNIFGGMNDLIQLEKQASADEGADEEYPDQYDEEFRNFERPASSRRSARSSESSDPSIGKTLIIGGAVTAVLLIVALIVIISSLGSTTNTPELINAKNFTEVLIEQIKTRKNDAKTYFTEELLADESIKKISKPSPL